MGQVLHGNATTTHAIRKAIQEAPEEVSNNALANRYGIHFETVKKWRERDTVEDRPSGLEKPSPKTLTKVEEAACVLFRTTTKLSLDDCLYSLQDEIPQLKRSNLQRVFQNHRISTLPKEEKEKRETKAFKDYPIGYFHVDIAQVNTEEGRLYMFVAIDCPSKYAYVELHDKSTREIAVLFLEHLIEKIPFTVHTVLTDNGSLFTDPRNSKVYKEETKSDDLESTKPIKCNAFDAICVKNNIEHRLTLPHQHWTNEQVERMNRTIKEATLKKCHYLTHDKLKEHLQCFVDTYNYSKRLKALRGLTVFDYINKCWQNEPERFKTDPRHMIPVTYK